MNPDKRALLLGVAGVLPLLDAEYLLSPCPGGLPYAGYWVFAGGKVEPSESGSDALKHELAE